MIRTCLPPISGLRSSAVRFGRIGTSHSMLISGAKRICLVALQKSASDANLTGRPRGCYSFLNVRYAT
jgi:hypothetical protein